VTLFLVFIICFQNEDINWWNSCPWKPSTTWYHLCCTMGINTHIANLLHLHSYDGFSRTHWCIKDSHFEYKLHGQMIGGLSLSSLVLVSFILLWFYLHFDSYRTITQFFFVELMEQLLMSSLLTWEASRFTSKIVSESSKITYHSKICCILDLSCAMLLEHP